MTRNPYPDDTRAAAIFELATMAKVKSDRLADVAARTRSKRDLRAYRQAEAEYDRLRAELPEVPA